MTIDPTVLGIMVAVVTGLIGKILWDGHTRQKTQFHLQDRNEYLEKRVLDLQSKIDDLQKREDDRVEDNRRRNDHGRDPKQLAILKFLSPHEGKRLGDIAKHLELSETTTIYHLQSLSNDGLVTSSNYSKQPHLAPPFYSPSNSTWTIQQLGLAYLQKNGELN